MSRKISVPLGLTREEEKEFRRRLRDQAREHECPGCAADIGERCRALGRRAREVEWVHDVRMELVTDPGVGPMSEPWISFHGIEDPGCE